MAEPAFRSIVTQRLDIDLEWNRVSPKYVVVVIVSTLVGGVIAAAIATALWFMARWPLAWIALIVIAVVVIVALIIAPRRARAIGYVLRDDDLLMRRGIMFQRFVAVPYGRMQLIDMNRGPVARILGLAELRFVTAAAATNVSIPGLPESEAVRLRDTLVRLAESRRAGL
jgi:membrane protein YdbS with pleckstrin-like domain